jgi:dienelactone hydrolase
MCALDVRSSSNRAPRASFASGQENRNDQLGQVQQRQARERGEMPAKVPDAIEAYLSKPDGSGPFPAVVYPRGCNGLSTNTRNGMAELITSWGYVSLVVDSFTTRAQPYGGTDRSSAATVGRDACQASIRQAAWKKID